MLDLARLERLKLVRRPFSQRFFGRFLGGNYRWFPGIELIFEDDDRIPDRPVIFAMNHTDRYNYFPFQYKLWKRFDRFTATWVKGKYYENRAVGFFMERMNNIPTVSRGYLITRDFLATLGRRPSDVEYAALRAWVDAVSRGEDVDAPPEAPRPILERPRDLLGMRFHPQRTSYARAIDALFCRMMERFVELNDEASELGLDILIFPQGTRSKRLSKGRVGLSQIAMHLGRAVVPVGCNGSDRIYPGSSPFAKAGRIVYRIGEPIRRADAAAWVERGGFVPFTKEAERDHSAAFETYIDAVMVAIDSLLDAEYRFGDDEGESRVVGSDRFV